jgi:hypothetical protein
MISKTDGLRFESKSISLISAFTRLSFVRTPPWILSISIAFS